jgi:threonylcarbamoyladenosine tRNA methylthiotransferase MtaB
LPKLPLLTSFKEQTRAFLKVQDGCDGVCSYCIIPKIRPEVQSKPIEDAVFEAKALVSAGHKEIVVTGVNLGAYGRQTVRKTEGERQRSGSPAASQVSRHSGTGRTEDGGQRAEQRTSNIERPTLKKEALSVLLDRLAGVEGLRRIRVSSLEPGDISEGLLDVFCRHKNIMPHIHLSVQSGSDRILRRMRRQYGAEELREKIALIKSRLDRPAITCDLIVGFPGETEEDFQQTVELAKWAGFSKMHVFPFSARAGTPAAKMKDRIQPKVVKERAEVLRKLGDELAFKFREQFVGESCEVLFEGSKDGQAFGHCERYFMVYVGPLLRGQGGNFSGRARQIRMNEIVNIKITAVTEEETTGSPVANSKK